MCFALAIVCLLFFCSSTPAAAEWQPPISMLQQVQQVRLAVAIGNNEYQNFARLHNAAPDAQAMAQKLGQLNFEVLHRDATGKFSWAAAPGAAHIGDANCGDFRQVTMAICAKTACAIKGHKKIRLSADHPCYAHSY